MAHSMPLILQQATADPHLHQRLLDTPGQVWVSLLWGHCSFLRGPGAQGSVCALPESISQSCVSSGGSMMGLMATSSKRAYNTPSPPLTRTSAGDTQTQFWLSPCRLGTCFVSFPGLSISCDRLLGECTAPGGLCLSITSLVPRLHVPRENHPKCACVSSEGLISGCDHQDDQPSRISERPVSSWEPAHSWVEDVISGA